MAYIVIMADELKSSIARKKNTTRCGFYLDKLWLRCRVIVKEKEGKALLEAKRQKKY